MKVVLDIETIQAPREEWARLTGKFPPSEGSDPASEGYDLFAAGAAEAQRRLEDEHYAKSAFDGTFDRFGSVGAASWVNYFLTPLIVYLLVMPVVLWSDYAITRWVFAIVLGMGLLAAFLGWQGVSLPGDVMRVAFEAEHWGLGPALFDWSLAMAGPEPAGAVWTAEALWFAVGMGLTVLTAVFRPDDLRRLVRTG